jgi:putative PIN family toxin of toxin-antitoxin system
MRSSRKRKPVVVLDTNVWVSAMIWGGAPAKIVEAAERGEIEVIASMEIISEIGDVLSYSKIESVYSEAGLSRRDLVEAVFRVARIINVDMKAEAVAEDPSDNKFIECALVGGAGYVVSGDRHLIKLGSYNGVRVLSVSEFLKII